MTEQEIIQAAKTNWLAWQGLNELQPEVAAWMEGHRKDLIYYTGKRWAAGWDGFDKGINRLRPDYEPEPKATHGWREYAITRDERGYCVWTDAGYRWPLHVLADSPTMLGLFGGVQFKGQNEPYWYTDTNALKDDCGNITHGAFPHETDTPAVPIKARFWEDQQ